MIADYGNCRFDDKLIGWGYISINFAPKKQRDKQKNARDSRLRPDNKETEIWLSFARSI